MLEFRLSPLVLSPSPLVSVQIFWWMYRARKLQLVSPSLSCFIVFFYSFLSSIYLSFHLPSVLPNRVPEQQSPLFDRFSFFVDYHLAWSSGRDWMIRLYLKIPANFVRLIFSDGFWIEHIPFFRMVKFKLLGQFTVDHFPHSVVFSLILFLC